MCSCLNNFATVEHHYLIGVSNRTQPVGDHDNRLAFIEPVEILYYRTLVAGIKGIGCLIKEYKNPDSYTRLAL